MNENSWTIGRLLEWTRSYFEEHELDQPRLCAEVLLAHALGCQKIALYTRFDEIPLSDALSAFRTLVCRAVRHEPVAYLTGHKEFFSLDFEVTSNVLIPRPETETLVEVVIESVREQGKRGCHILEIGTGSGCIAVALAKYLPEARITAVDLSSAALAVAGRNVEKHGLNSRIKLLDSDGVDLDPAHRPDGGFGGICSNPPYVAEQDRETLPPEVRDHEPERALFGGPDGLAFYRRLAGEIADLLSTGGWVCLEIGYGQEEAVVALFSDGGLSHQGTMPDPTGIPRVVQFRKP